MTTKKYDGNEEKPDNDETPTNDEKPANDEKPKDDDELQLSKLRLPQNFESIVGGKKLTQYLPVKKPEKQWFIRTHPNREMWFYAAILDFQEDRDAYIVEEELWQELANEVVPKVLIPSMTSHGHSFIWPIRVPGEDGRIDDWSRTAFLAAEQARKQWLRLISNMQLGLYDTMVAATMLPDPTWPDFGLEEWLRLGFRDKIISSVDHTVVRRLRGEQ